MNLEDISKLIELPLLTLLKKAANVHGQLSDQSLTVSSLISVKTGRCPEDCNYCPQSAHYNTGLKAQSLMDLADFKTQVKRAKSLGAQRICFGAAWRKIEKSQMPILREYVSAIKNEGLEACATLGMTETNLLLELKAAGLDYYNHNVDTSESFYPKIVTTRKYQQRIQTLKAVEEVGLKVCTGGILGLGETVNDRVQMLFELLSLFPNLPSLTINTLIQTPGTPFENNDDIPFEDLLRFIATARIVFPNSQIRMSAGRNRLLDEQQFLILLVGVSSIFLGENLLTTANVAPAKDLQFFSDHIAKDLAT